MKTAIEMLKEAQELLNLNQKELGTYIGVSTRTVNSWMTGERTCPDHVAEMALRLARIDAKALEEDEPTTAMMRWAVIDSYGIDEYLTVCGSKADALREAENDWNHLTAAEKANRERFLVGLINVQICEKAGFGGRFEYANIEGRIDGDVYECAKDRLDK